MIVAVKQYVDIMRSPARFTRRLGAADVECDASGHPRFFTGNRSVVFKVRYGGRLCALKCYTCHKPNLRRIYGEQCLQEEIYVVSEEGRGEFVDAVLCDWQEGRTLRSEIADAAGDEERMRSLAGSFDRFAAGLLEAEWAHGDLKPGNIIVDASGEMTAIDFDAVYRPDLADMRCDEAGTAAFQHPRRTTRFYNKSVDDYSIALISTALNAMACDRSLHGMIGCDDGLLVDPREAVAGRSAMVERIAELFAGRCMAVERRIARMLTSPVPQLPELRELMRWKVSSGADASGRDVPRLAERDGLWGYRSGDRFVIPPVYDYGFEFSEGLAAVRCGDWFYYLSPSGRPAISVGKCDWVKPFRDRKAVVMRNRERYTIDRSIYPPPTIFGR